MTPSYAAPVLRCVEVCLLVAKVGVDTPAKGVKGDPRGGVAHHGGVDGSKRHVQVGGNISVQDGADAARLIALNMMATLKCE